jgi:hypothetical protein
VRNLRDAPMRRPGDTGEPGSRPHQSRSVISSRWMRGG